jgi:primosomal protein N' (replication factor Y)
MNISYLYLDIQLLSAINNKKLTFTYHAVAHKTYSIGDFVAIPLRKKITWGTIKYIHTKKPIFETKEIFFHIAIKSTFHTFLRKSSYYYNYPIEHMYNKICSLLSNLTIKKNNTLMQKNIILQSIILSRKQKVAHEIIQSKIKNNEIEKPFLLYGITGSGKTHVYASIIKNTIESNKSVLCLVPDVTLAQNTILTLKKHLGENLPIFSFHSASEKQEKQLAYNHIIHNSPCVIVGVQLPVFLPILTIGLIIIDEEHDTGFIEQQSPFFNIKEIALLRSFYEQIPIILTSATPSINALHNAKNELYILIELNERFYNTKLPEVTKIVLTKNESLRKNFWLSNELTEEIKHTLENKEQVILFLNRKGMYSFAKCNACGFLFSCSQCSLLYTVYEHNKLQCNKCFETTTLPDKCPSCKPSHNTIAKKGIGGQLLKKIVSEMFPTTRVELADLSTMSDKKQWKYTVEKMQHKEIDILIGTQLIARGYHFPHVNLVGVIWADMTIGNGGFASCEQTIQMLIQVSGRAGRETGSGKVIIQTVHENDIFNCSTESEYTKLYDAEIEFRKQYNQPPFSKMGLLIISGEEKESEIEALSLYNILKSDLTITTYKPIKPPIYKIKKKYYWYIYLKSDKYKYIINSVNKIYTIKKPKIYYNFIPNPVVSYY